MGLLFRFLTLPFAIIGRMFEAPRKSIDKTLGRTKCPRCRSANVRKAGRKWHCNDCGRDFK